MAGPIVRQGIVLLGVELKTPKLDGGPISSALADQEQKLVGAAESATKYATELERTGKAAGNAATGVRAAATASAEAAAAQAAVADNASESAKSFGALAKDANKIRTGFTEAGEGALKFARGLAFIGASSEQDLAALARGIAQIEGTFNVFSGGAKLITSLTATMGPAGAAVGGLTIVLGAGALAWRQWAQDAAEAKRQAEAAKRAIEADKREAQRLAERLGGQSIGLALTPEERATRRAAEEDRLRKELKTLRADLAREQADLSRGPEAFRKEAGRLVAGPRGIGARRTDFEAEVQNVAERMSRAFQPAVEEIQDVIDVERRRAEVTQRLIDLEKEYADQAAHNDGALRQAQDTLDTLFEMLQGMEQSILNLERKRKQAETGVRTSRR